MVIHIHFEVNCSWETVTMLCMIQETAFQLFFLSTVYYVYGLVGYTECMCGHTYNVIIKYVWTYIHNIIVHVHIKCVR